MDFRVYYDGGAVYAGDPFDAPAWGVLVIVQTDHNHGRNLVMTKDYFVWTGSKWMTVDYIGMLDYLSTPGHKKVLFGRMVEDEYFYTVVKRANEDPDFPERTAFSYNENYVKMALGVVD